MLYGGYLALTESLICNGYRDCSDGTDEANCGFQGKLSTIVRPVL